MTGRPAANYSRYEETDDRGYPPAVIFPELSEPRRSFTSIGISELIVSDSTEGVYSVRERVRELAGVLPAAAAAAEALADRFQENDHDPDTVQRSADGSVMFYFYGERRTEGGAHRRYVVFECSEDGVAALRSDRVTNEVEALDLESDEDYEKAFVWLGEFLTA